MAEEGGIFKKLSEALMYFFPLRLLVLHFKKNHILLLFWLLLFGLCHGMIGAGYGISHLFFYPEYLGKNDFTAFAILGFSFGGFILAFNLYTYILHGYRFPFSVTFGRPFATFSYNNLILPVVFSVTFLAGTIRYQVYEELLEGGEIVLNVLGFVFGMFVFLALSTFYFAKTNRSFLPDTIEPEKKMKRTAASSVIHRSSSWMSRRNRPAGWRVDHYLSWPLRLKKVRSIDHYDRKMLEDVLSQNHVNASLFIAILLVSFVMLGGLGEHPVFLIPAAASGVLLLTVLLMFFSALFTWIRGWTYGVVLFLLLIINFYHKQIPIIKLETYAYGMDYTTTTKPAYNREVIESYNLNDSIYREHFNQTLVALENWRRKQLALSGPGRPKLVLLTVSGGGHRSALWTMVCLNHIHRELGYSLLDRVQLMTGASGGLIGASYYRELYRRNLRGEEGYGDITSRDFEDRIAADLLNPILFKVATNDLFIRYRKFRMDDKVYIKDRAYAFEYQLHRNTNYVLDKPLIDYRASELSGEIPMLVMSPTITNDGRRLLLSSIPVAYLCRNASVVANPLAVPEVVDFLTMFGDSMGGGLRFSSALRMNATFPYILPMTTLPTEPSIELMDAGLRDNFGTKLLTNYLFQIRNWINTNTSGVVIVQIRDLPKDFQGKKGERTMLGRFTGPVGSVSGNYTRMQDYTNDQLLQMLEVVLEEKIEMVMFQLFQEGDKGVSLSWHLNKAERQHIRTSVLAEPNRKALERLTELMSR
jgi:hypothetical protein